MPGAWLFLALSGRWRAKADWIDRLGRILAPSGSCTSPTSSSVLAHQLAPRSLNEDFVVERARPIDRLDVAILTITAMAGAVAVAFNDREAVRFLQERPAVTSLTPWAQTVRVSCRRVESDFKALLAVATLGVGVAVLSHPHRLRTKSWPGPGVSAMAVAALAEIFMIAWHAHMISQGHYWLDRNLSYLIVFGTWLGSSSERPARSWEPGSYSSSQGNGVRGPICSTTSAAS